MVSHPTQHHVPLYQRLAHSEVLSPTVLFLSNHGVRPTYDAEFYRTIRYDARSRRVGRARRVRDVPVGDRPVMLVWTSASGVRAGRVRRGSWRETSPQIRPPGRLTERARRWAVRWVGRDGTAVSQLAADLGVGWHTVNNAVVESGSAWSTTTASRGCAAGSTSTTCCAARSTRGPLGPPRSWSRLWPAAGCGRKPPGSRPAARSGATASSRPRLTPTRATRRRCAARCLRPSLTTSACPGRQPGGRRGASPRSSRRPLATAAARTRAVPDPKKLLLVAVERLDDRAHERIRQVLDVGDPYFEVESAWHARQLLSAVYDADDPVTAAARFKAFLDWAKSRRGRRGLPAGAHRATLARRHPRLPHPPAVQRPHRGHGRTVQEGQEDRLRFRNFRNYRVRLLLHCGVKWDTPPTPRSGAAPPRCCVEPAMPTTPPAAYLKDDG